MKEAEKGLESREKEPKVNLIRRGNWAIERQRKSEDWTKGEERKGSLRKGGTKMTPQHRPSPEVEEGGVKVS